MVVGQHITRVMVTAFLVGWLGMSPVRGEALTDAQAQDGTRDGVPDAVRGDHERLGELLARYCADCHGDDTAQGQINVERMLQETPLVRRHRDWTNVLQRTVDGDMPPRRSDQPTRSERDELVALIDRLVMGFDYATVVTPGYEPLRRLTRREYGNTLSDLLGVRLDVTDRFPPEMVGASGFDNSANTLFVQRGLMERYLTTAEWAVEQALPARATAAQWAQVIGAAAVQRDPGVAQAEAAFAYFLPRAYRRPVTDPEIQGRLAYYLRAVEQGLDHATALRIALTNTLIEAPFLFRMEGGDREDAMRTEQLINEPTRIDAFALASRLSYFLWASMPDDELFRLAGEADPARRLDHPDVLRAQVDRMLDHPKALSLGTAFASQWLGFTHIGSRRRPDPIDNPVFTDSLFEAMRMESAHVFADLVRNNRPLQEIIDSDFTYVNEELANFYGWYEVQGEQMRRIRVPDQRRGGFLTQASVLMITAFPDRTSPVVRGNWLLSELLGTPPPPPPPDAAEFSERLEDAEISLARKMALHRQKPSCANCHSRIDPLGLALENFDNFGRWRDREDEGEGPRIDARGKLPEGAAFRGPVEFKRVLLQHRLDDMNRQIARKMLSYALGRPLSYTDEHTVRVIAERVKASGYRARTLIRQVIESDAFLYQQRPPAAVAIGDAS